MRATRSQHFHLAILACALFVCSHAHAQPPVYVDVPINFSGPSYYVQVMPPFGGPPTYTAATGAPVINVTRFVLFDWRANPDPTPSLIQPRSTFTIRRIADASGNGIPLGQQYITGGAISGSGGITPRTPAAPDLRFVVPFAPQLSGKYTIEFRVDRISGFTSRQVGNTLEVLSTPPNSVTHIIDVP